jgi:hypothetical protein
VRRIAWAMWGLSMLGLLAGLTLGFADGTSASAFVALAGYSTFLFAAATVGALVALRRPENAIGWILSAAALGFALAGGAIAYSEFAFRDDRATLPLATAVAWVGNWLWTVVVGLMAVLPLLLFPDGKLPSRRWRPVAWLVPPATVLAVLSVMLDPGPLQVTHAVKIANPTALAEGSALPRVLGALGFLGIVGGFLAALAAVVLRFRRSSGEARLQLKWLVYSGALILLTILANPVVVAVLGSGNAATDINNGVTSVALTSYPVALGVAILKHRLYDIDVVINRTLVYAALTATLAASYLGSVLLLQLALDPITSGSSLAVAVSTLAVAALFRPARARIQSAVDKRFYRHKYDASQTLEDFSTRLREQVDLEALGGELRSVVAETMQPAHVSLWLRERRP